MNGLHRTQESLAEFAAQDMDIFGSHLFPEAHTGRHGLVLGELDYNPRRDSLQSVVRSSVRELVTGQPQVHQIEPMQSLVANIVVHQRPSVDSYGIPEAKSNLAMQLETAVSESMPGITDYARPYVVGENVHKGRSSHSKTIETDGSPEADAAAVAKICMTGLTFVISDFLHLPLASMAKKYFPGTVAIKANHKVEMAIPDVKVGRIALPYGGELNTNKPKEVQRINDALRELHGNTVNGLGRLGIGVAPVLIDLGLKNGYCITSADRVISKAINSIRPF